MYSDIQYIRHQIKNRVGANTLGVFALRRCLKPMENGTRIRA